MVVTLVAYAVLMTGAIAVWDVPAADQWTMGSGLLDANGKEVVDASALAECRSVDCLRERSGDRRRVHRRAPARPVLAVPAD
jgi:hypothetical protein